MSPRKDSQVCVVAYNPGLVAAAVFDMRGSSPACVKLWTEGARPAWVYKASRNMKTLVLDASLPTLADSADDVAQARQRMARLGMDDASDIALLPNCVVAVRGAGVAQACELAGSEGIVADAATSFAAVELGTLLKEIGTGDGARLVFHEKAAYLISRGGGKLSARRFSMPAGAAELTATLQLMPDAQITLEGLLGGDAPDWSPPYALRSLDRRKENGGKVYASLLERAADLWMNDHALAVFAPRNQGAKNAARRWLAPAALALALLCIAATLPLADAFAKAQAEEQRLAALQERQTQMQARAKENAPTLQRIEALSRAQNASAAQAARSQRTLVAILAVQTCATADRHLRIDRLAVDEGGHKLAICGTVPSGNGDELGDFVARLGKSHYKPASDVALHESGGTLVFALNMEAKP